MYDYDEIGSVHLEVTTKCNAACPQCPRNVNGGSVNPNLPITELTLDLAMAILTPNFLRQLRQIIICGNYGDAMSARDIVSICQYFRENNPWLDIELHTNGSLRETQLWAELATTVTRCVFAIDGLEDSNHIYRQKTNWDLIMNNVKTFIRAGGNAEWNFIVFRHNEHQVDTAQDLARSMGFKKFFIKRTGRFIKRGVIKDSFPILNSGGATVGMLQIPLNPNFRNPAAEQLQEVVLTTGRDFDSVMASATITCPAMQSKSIYISAEGLVFPCCWMGQIYPAREASKRKKQILDLLETYGGGVNAISAKYRSIEAIVGSEVFQVAIPNGWREGAAKLEICSRQCGQYRLSQAQKSGSSI